MPIIRIEMFEGRTADQKRALAKALTEAFIRTAGGTPEQVHIVMTDVAKDDWAIAGKLCSDPAPG